MTFKILIPALVALTSTLWLAAPSLASDSHAQSGTITFKGNVARASCEISNWGNIGVEFGKVSASRFGAQKDTVAVTRHFNIVLSKCNLDNLLTPLMKINFFRMNRSF